MILDNNITEYMRAKLAVRDWPVSDKYTKILEERFEKMRGNREVKEMIKETCPKCPGQEMCRGLNCTCWECPCINCMPLNMDEALVQIRASPERPSSDDQGFALIADAMEARKNICFLVLYSWI